MLYLELVGQKFFMNQTFLTDYLCLPKDFMRNETYFDIFSSTFILESRTKNSNHAYLELFHQNLKKLPLRVE